MINVFRNIRKMLISNKSNTEPAPPFLRYVLYAIGEILLVVIGILIALQVNNWNTRRIQKKTEINYLKEIKSNLNDDLLDIKNVETFNLKKFLTIDSMFQLFEKFDDPNKYMPGVSNYMYVLTEFEQFSPNRIAFDNMISSANIDLISHNDLRNNLSKYYKKEFLSSTQERIKELTRTFTDYASEIIFNRQLLKMVTGYESRIKDVSEVNIHKDEKLSGLLFGMRINIRSQNELLENTEQEIKSLIELIDYNLKMYE